MANRDLLPVTAHADLNPLGQIPREKLSARTPLETNLPAPSIHFSMHEDRTLLSLEQFSHLLNESGLLSIEEMNDVLAGLPQYRTVEELAESLYRCQKLTKYQLRRVIQGKAKSLYLGNYTVLDKLGQGGMGVVVKARHRVMQRIVAIKVLSASTMKSPDAIKRFHREVEAAARLNHPNIVTAFDADQANGTHFLVMEYVDGYNLSTLVRTQGPLSIRRAIEFLLQVGRGLEFAHNQGVVHRDIKPANLLIDRSGIVRILDLGLARLENSEQQTDITGSGQIMGTIDYMAPEQAVNTRTADHRADIYSFGCTLWFLLTGKPVFSGETALAKLLQHREGPIPSLLMIGGQLNVKNSRAVAVDRVIRKMLAKRPDQRYQSMTEVLQALEDCLSGKPEAAEALPKLPAVNEEPLTSFLSFLSHGGDSDAEVDMVTGDRTIPTMVDDNHESASLVSMLTSPAARPGVPMRALSVWANSNPIWLGGIIGGVGLIFLGILLSIWSNRTVPITPTAAAINPIPVNLTLETPAAHSNTKLHLPPLYEETHLFSPSDRIPGVTHPHKNHQLAFDGTKSYVQIESLPLQTNETYTCEAWFTLIGERDRFSSPLIWSGPHGISIAELGQSFGVSHTTASLMSNQMAPLMVPVHVAGVWKGTEQTLYLNGRRVEIFHATAATIPNSKDRMFLGGAPSSDNTLLSGFRGAIDEVRISRGTRYRMTFAPLRRFPDRDPDTVALYHLDEVSGEIAHDASGHGHHGTVVNARWIPAASPHGPAPLGPRRPVGQSSFR